MVGVILPVTPVPTIGEFGDICHCTGGGGVPHDWVELLELVLLLPPAEGW